MSSQGPHATLLSVSGLSLRFGGIVALDKVYFTVKKASITAIIGPNGAGKTTIFNCLTGFYRAQEGQIQFYQGEKPVELRSLLGRALRLSDIFEPWSLWRKAYLAFFGGTHLICRAGLARTFQNIRLFNEMSVLENLLVAQHRSVNRNLLSGLFLSQSFRKAEAKALQKARDWLEVVGLSQYANHLAGSLPYGHQRRLEIARALCADPQMICLDEPAAGLNPKETQELAQLIRLLRDQYQLTVLVIEHDMSLVMDISDHVVVLNYGKVIAAAKPSAIQTNPEVLAAYLGTGDEP